MNTRGGRKTPVPTAGGSLATTSKRRRPSATSTSAAPKRSAAVASRRNASSRRNETSIGDDDDESNSSTDDSSDSSSSSGKSSHHTSQDDDGSSSDVSRPSTPLSMLAGKPRTARRAPSEAAPTVAPSLNKRRLPANGSAASDGTHSTKRARCNSQRSTSPTDGISVDAYLVKRVLSAQYNNVVERLQLDFHPTCLSNLEYCAKEHARHGEPRHEIDEYLVADARAFIAEDRPQQFIKFVSKMSICNKFPGPTVMLCLLELILTVNKPLTHQFYTESSIIESANMLFENITNNFPPCWLDVRDAYKKLLVEKMHMDLPKSYDMSGGILKTILSMLEIVLQKENDTKNHNESLEFEEFLQWEQQTRQRYLFDRLARDDQLDRIFQVLHLIVKLMEGDLAIWIIRHPTNTNTVMSKPKRMPLIGYFLWPAETCGQINATVKNILNLFVICISIGLANDKINILARLVNLISHAINMCELQPHSTAIKYPNIVSQTESFALEVKKTIEKVQSCNVDLFLAVIDHLRAPFIQIIAIDQLLMKFNRDAGKPSMKKLYLNFTKKRWRECDEQGSRKLFTHLPEEHGFRYPVHRPQTQKKRTSDIYQTDYLHLLLSSYKSYHLLYKVDVIARLTLNPEEGEAVTRDANSNAMTESEYKEQMRAVDQQRQTRFDYDEMEKCIQRLERSAEKKAGLDLTYYPANTSKENDIIVDTTMVIRYQEDVKFYGLLRTLIEEYASEYGEIFTPWLNAVRYEPTMPSLQWPL